MREVQETRGFDKKVLSAAEARTRQIPLAKKGQFPVGQDPGDCVNEARRVANTSIAPDAAAAAPAPLSAAPAPRAAAEAPTVARRVLNLDPNCPDALSEEDLFRFMLDYD